MQSCEADHFRESLCFFLCNLMLLLLTGSSPRCPFFYVCSYLDAPQSCKSIVSTNFPNKSTLKQPMTQFSILIVSWSKSFNNFLRLFTKPIYSFVVIDFWCFSKISDFHFYISKELMNI